MSAREDTLRRYNVHVGAKDKFSVGAASLVAAKALHLNTRKEDNGGAASNSDYSSGNSGSSSGSSSGWGSGWNAGTGAGNNTVNGDTHITIHIDDTPEGFDMDDLQERLEKDILPKIQDARSRDISIEDQEEEAA